MIMNLEYAKKLKEYFPQIYKTYLQKFLSPDQVNQIFADPNVATAFNNVLNLVYNGATFGNKFDNQIKQALLQYEQAVNTAFGFTDEYLRQFLHIYRFYASSTYTGIVATDGTYVAQNEADYFSKLSYVCCEACENLFTDLKNGNRWWELDTPTTLRRQLMNDRLVIPVERLQKLCRAYLGREIDLEKELHLNEGKTTPPLDLVSELDRKMAKKGMSLVCAWVEEINGKRQMVESPTPPTDNRYYLKRYVPTRDSSRQG